MSSIILKQLKKEAVIFCPLCSQEYTTNNMRIVEQAGETILGHSQCPKCQGAILSLLFSDFIGVTLIGMVTDLDYQDAIRLKESEALDEDDVLQVYQLLN